MRSSEHKYSKFEEEKEEDAEKTSRPLPTYDRSRGGNRDSVSSTSTDAYTDYADDMFADRASNTKLSHREKLFEIVEITSENKWGKMYRVFMLITTFLGLVTFILSTEPEVYAMGPSRVLLSLEIVAVGSWTIDFVLRLACAPVWYKWLAEYMHVFEFIFIATFYAYLGVGPASYDSSNVAYTIVRILQTLRAFQIIRIIRYSPTIKLVLKTLHKCKEAFFLLLVLILMITIISASLIFYAEQSGSHFDVATKTWYRNRDGSVSPFQSIASTMWWSMVTITTVGYGDTYPVTDLGKVVACFTMVCSLLTLALPIGIFGAYFSEGWHLHSLELKESRKKRTRKERELADYGPRYELENLQIQLLKLTDELNVKQKMVSEILQRLSKQAEEEDNLCGF